MMEKAVLTAIETKKALFLFKAKVSETALFFTPTINVVFRYQRCDNTIEKEEKKALFFHVSTTKYYKNNNLC